MTDPANNDLVESKHAVTTAGRCRAMERKYHWRLLRIEPTEDKILKFNCVFAGKTVFPDYLEEDNGQIYNLQSGGGR